MPQPLARRQLLLGAVASLAPALSRATSALPPMQLAFEERFAGPASFYDPASGQGRWKTNYWFGDQKDQSSRCLPNERQIYVDRAYCGIDPFATGKGGLKITADAQVVGSDWKPMPGLYTCGEMVGGLFHYNYPLGTGLMSGAVFGRIAGRSAARS